MNGRTIDLPALKQGAGNSVEGYFCRSGGDLGANKTKDGYNPRFRAYEEGNMLTSQVWDKEKGAWALGARQVIAIWNQQFYWMVTRPTFEECLDFPVKDAVSTPIDEFMKNVKRRIIGKVRDVRHHMPLPKDYRPSSSSSMYSSFSSSSSSGRPLIMEIVPPFIEWSLSVKCPWKYYRMILPYTRGGDFSKIKFRRELEARCKDPDHRYRILSKMVWLYPRMINKWDLEAITVDFKGTMLKDENDVNCLYVKEVPYVEEDDRPCMNVTLDQFLALMEIQQGMESAAEQFMQLIKKPGTELDPKRWTYYKTIPPTNSKGIVDFTMVKDMCLHRDVNASLRDLTHHYFEGNARTAHDNLDPDELVESIAKGGEIPVMPNYRWVWHLKARLEEVERGITELRVESVRNDDFGKTPPFRHVDMQEFARLLHYKNRGPFSGNSATTYTFFKLLNLSTWGESVFADPPLSDEPFGSSACEIMTEMATFVDDRDTSTSSTSHTTSSLERKRQG